MRYLPFKIPMCAVGASLLTLLVASAPAQAQTPMFGWGQSDDNLLNVAGGWSAQRGWLSARGALPFATGGRRWSAFASDGTRLSDLIAQRNAEDNDMEGVQVNASGSIGGAPDRIRLVVSGVARPIPRLARPQKLNNPVYQAAVGALLRQNKARVTNARLTQIMRVDLNGDKTDEVLICAHTDDSKRHNASAIAGDYAVVALRFLDARSGKVRIVPLEIQADLSKYMNPSRVHYQILGCADLNGDGKQEVVIYSTAWESRSVSAWTFDGRRVKQIVDTASGL